MDLFFTNTIFARSGHWTGWYKNKMLLIGGTNGMDKCFNDVWMLEPQKVEELDVWITAGIAAGGTAIFGIFVALCWSRWYRKKLFQGK